VSGVELFEAWWLAKQSAEFRDVFADAPDLHGGDREKRWGSAYLDKERVAFLAGYDSLSRRVAELEQVLRVCRATLPHVGGNPMSMHSLCADIDAALKGQG
jgi:hypothetical protein